MIIIFSFANLSNIIVANTVAVTSFICLCCRIPDSIGKDIEKACQSIYPLHDVYIRKVKVLKKPKFDSKFLCMLQSKLIDCGGELKSKYK